jgi:hypothetical protein
VLARAMMSAIRFYQKGISPLKPPVCRFHPTCSHYGMEALQRYGAAGGSWLLLKRLLRCNPLCKGGFDPVP